MQEEWKEIEGFSRYKISEDGVVWDIQKECKTPTTWNGNFLCTNLIRDDGVKVLCKIHRMVALSFIPNPENAHNVIHIDEDRSNNHYTNLKWKPKKVKEPVEKIVQKYQHKDREYSITELSLASGVDEKTIYHRLRSEWSVGEILRNHKDFKGQGYQTETHWFPTKKQMEKHRIEQDRLAAQAKREARQKQKEDWLNRKKYGVGVFVNYPIQGIINRVPTKTYRVWDGMLGRCYGENKETYAGYGALGVKVCEDWKEFQKFALWYESQPQGEDWHIDKDILCPKGETPIYCPEYCVLVPPEVNAFFATLPTNISASAHRGLYRTSLSVLGERVNFSSKSREEVVDFYWKTKIRAANLLADKYEDCLDERVIDTLRNIPIPL